MGFFINETPKVETNQKDLGFKINAFNDLSKNITKSSCGALLRKIAARTSEGKQTREKEVTKVAAHKYSNIVSKLTISPKRLTTHGWRRLPTSSVVSFPFPKFSLFEVVRSFRLLNPCIVVLAAAFAQGRDERLIILSFIDINTDKPIITPNRKRSRW